MESERLIAGESLTGAHEGDIFRKRNAVVLIVQQGWTDVRPLQQSCLTGALRNGDIGKPAGEPRCDRQVRHRPISPLIPAVMSLMREVMAADAPLPIYS